MKNKFVVFIIAAAIITGGLFMSLTNVQATGSSTIMEYTVLVGLPGLEAGSQTTLQPYLRILFQAALGVATVFAVMMIVIGGIQYMSSDAILKKNAGRERIKYAVLGLILIIAAWLILYTVNPRLLEFNLDIQPLPRTADVTTSGGSLGGLTPAMNTALSDLRAECPSCTIRITSTTGGTHDPSSAHYQGRAVDVAPDANLNQYLTGSTSSPAPCRTVIRTLGGVSATFLWEPTGATCGGAVPSSGDHWHMQVP